ncbi:MAG: ribosome small subunit-dependent GTPase A, partial [Catonella sp.]
MKGRIVKGIAGFYYVNAESKVYECKAKGLFRNNNIKPLVGDFVDIDIIDEEKALGHITKILPRKNTLIRPAVSNVDIIAVVQSTASPKPRPYLMD